MNNIEDVHKLISLLYIHTQNLGLKEINENNICSIYNVSPGIIEILKEENALRVFDKKNRKLYKWGAVYPTNEFKDNVHKKLLNLNTNNKKQNVMNEKVTKETEQAVIDTMHLSLKESAKIVGRTPNMISFLRTTVRKKGYVDNEEKKQPDAIEITTISGKKRRRWDEDDIRFLADNFDMNEEDIAKKLGRTVDAIKSKKSALINKKLKVNIPVARQKEVKTPTYNRRLRILWGALIDIQW